MEGKIKSFILKSFLICTLIFVGAIFAQYELRADNLEHVVISELQITGGTGKTKNDFIELYNPAGASFNLKGYRLVKRTKTGSTDTTIKSWTSDALIPSHGYYLWANSADGFANSINADATTTQTIANDNGIALRLGKEDEGEIIDSVGWGSCANIFIEGTVFPTNPGANQSLERKSNVDTDNNSADFFIQDVPNPQNSSWEPEPEEPVCGNGEVEEEEECDDNNTIDGDGCSALCITEYCGDNIVNNVNEECDDGNNIDGDGCSANCILEPYCGDGNLDPEEECDDGNNNDGDGCSAQCIIEGEEELSAKTIKEEVRDALEEIKTDNYWINKKINKILKYLDKSLTANWWQDNTHLNPKKGMKVFIYESFAVLKIKSLLYFHHWCRKSSLPEELKPVLEQAIVDLVKADRILAQVALEEAKDTLVNNPGYQERYNRMIELAEARFNKAEGYEDNHLRRAIYYYRKAWQFSQRAIQYAIRD